MKIFVDSDDDVRLARRYVLLVVCYWWSVIGGDEGH